MHYENNLEHLGTTVENLNRYWASRRQGAAAQRDLPPHTARGFTIAVAGEVGALATSVAQEVGQRLGWHVYDHELLERIAQEMGVRAALLKSVDERQQSWLLESVQAFLADPERSGASVSESSYVRHLVQTVLALGIHAESVIVGRGAAFILAAATTLRVWLVAPVEDRIVNLSRKLAISEQEAARQLGTIDRERNGFVQDHFLKDPTDARQYDLVLNTGRLSTVAAADLMIDALRHLQECASDNGRV